MFLLPHKSTCLILTAFILPSCSTVNHNQVTAKPATETVRPNKTDEPKIKTADVPIIQVSIVQESDQTERIPTLLPAEDDLEKNPIKPVETLQAQWSLNDLEQLALRKNPGLEEARARAEAARGKWQQVGLKPNPRLGYSGQQLGSSGLAEQHGVYLEQEFIRGDKLTLNRAVVSHEISHAVRLFEVQRRRVLTDVRVEYYNVLCSQKRLVLTEELVQIGNQATEIAQVLFKNKEGSRQDYLQARIDSKVAENLSQKSQNEYIASWRKLAAVLGSPQMSPTSLTGQLDETTSELEWKQSLERLLSESPEISAAFAEVERARCAVSRAFAEATPDVNVQAVIQDDNATGSSNGALLISLPLPLVNRNQGGIRQAQSELIAAKRAAQRMELSLQNRLAPVFERYITGRTRVQSYRGGILQDAQESLDLTRQGYEAGELNFLNLLTSQRTYFRANLDYLDAVCQMWTASAQIEGLLLINSLEEGTKTNQL